MGAVNITQVNDTARNGPIGFMGSPVGSINTFKYHVFAPMGRFQLELIYLYFPMSFHQTVVSVL